MSSKNKQGTPSQEGTTEAVKAPAEPTFLQRLVNALLGNVEASESLDMSARAVFSLILGLRMRETAGVAAETENGVIPALIAETPQAERQQWLGTKDNNRDPKGRQGRQQQWNRGIRGYDAGSWDVSGATAQGATFSFAQRLQSAATTFRSRLGEVNGIWSIISGEKEGATDEIQAKAREMAEAFLADEGQRVGTFVKDVKALLETEKSSTPKGEGESAGAGAGASQGQVEAIPVEQMEAGVFEAFLRRAITNPALREVFLRVAGEVTAEVVENVEAPAPAEVVETAAEAVAA